jgi:hypothetical protein
VPERLRDNSITSTLAAEPDANRASNLLTHYIKAVAGRVLPPHMALALHGIRASVRIAGRDHRIMIGDYLEKTSKAASAVKTLAKCTGIRECEQRRRVREWIDGKWEKEHVVYNADESCYRVITTEAARALAPGAFDCEG